MSLAQNVHRMVNRELNALAQIRLIDEDTQVALAQHPYLRARKKLAGNSGLCDRARDILLNGKALSVKLELMLAGHINEDQDAIRDLYYAMRRRGMITRWSGWRMNMFVSGAHWHKGGIPNTPPEVVEEIFEASMSIMEDGHNYYASPYAVIKAVVHPNSTLSMAIRASQHKDAEIRRAGFERLVAIEKAKDSK